MESGRQTGRERGGNKYWLLDLHGQYVIRLVPGILEGHLSYRRTELLTGGGGGFPLQVQQNPLKKCPKHPQNSPVVVIVFCFLFCFIVL